jgi:transposase-like protein
MERRNHSAEFKAKIVIEVMKEVMSINEIASEHELHPNVVRRWKTEAIENMVEVFSDKNKQINEIKDEYEARIEELYKEIGRLTTQLSWVKKKSGHVFKQV